MTSELNPLIEAMPVRAGSWVQRQHDGKVAQVRAAYRDTSKGVVLVDLWFYTWSGDKTGRESDAMGGPRTYEPAIEYTGEWKRINNPTFPMRLSKTPDGDWSFLLPTIPDGNYLPTKPRKPGLTHSLRNQSRADLVLSHRMAAEELRQTIRDKKLTGETAAAILHRASQLDRIADEAEDQ